MPKDTFLNLEEEKRRRFVQAALEEFAHNSYAQASITKLVQRLGIAKGSVYQYFEDKRDLWLYLKTYAEGVKMRYVMQLRRADYADFWDFYRAMYASGIDFDLEEPLCSLFLYRIGRLEHSAEVEQFLNGWREQATAMFRHWVGEEQRAGAFRADLSAEALAHFMVGMSLSIADWMRERYRVDFQANISAGKPLFADDRAALMASVEELILLMRAAVEAR